MTAHLADAFVEEAHARLSPSGSKKWFACPGSITLEAPIPNKSSTYSDDGTAMHEVAAWCLTEHRRASQRVGDYIVVSAKGEPERKVKFTDEMADLVQGYVDAIRFIGIGNLLLVEQRVEFSEFVQVPNQFGTADAIVLDDREGELGVYDLKTGRTPVEVIKNTQLMFYALGALALLRDRDTQAAAKVAIDITPLLEENDDDLF